MKFLCFSHALGILDLMFLVVALFQQGDIDRDIFGHDNHPLPLHFMGIVMAQDQCTILLTVTSSLSGWQQRDGVKLRHLFAPELTFDGTVVQTTPCTATVRVTDEKGWLATLADIKQVISTGLTALVYTDLYSSYYVLLYNV